MTSADEPPISCRCPHCQARLKVRAHDAGQRRQCPQCGKRIKVPGAPGKPRRGGETASKPAASPPGSGSGVAHVVLVCPYCQTRLYASRQEVGQTMVCPHCLESVAVAAHEPPAARPESPRAVSPSARDEGSCGAGAQALDRGESDDYQLSDPIELPKHRSVSGALADLLDQHDVTSGVPGAGSAERASPPDRDPGAPPRPREFGVKCPVCDTMIYATEAEIGTTKACPDCYSALVVPPPRPKPRRVSDVVDSDYANDELVLGPPAELEIYRPADKDVAPRTVGETALAQAEREQAAREQEEPELPLAPLWTGVFAFLPDFVLIVRLVVNGILVGLTPSWGITVAGYIASDDPTVQFYGVVGCVALTVMIVVSVVVTCMHFLTVLLDSAEGCEKIENWPTDSVIDWVAESFSLLMAAFFAAAPGTLAGFLGRAIGMSYETTWLLAGLSVYVFFPVAQLSILESASLTNPLSKPILASLRNQFLLWCTFYIMALFIALAVAIALFSARLNHPPAMFVARGIFLVAAGFLYFRLLGRLAWACQMRHSARRIRVMTQQIRSRVHRHQIAAQPTDTGQPRTIRPVIPALVETTDPRFCMHGSLNCPLSVGAPMISLDRSACLDLYSATQHWRGQGGWVHGAGQRHRPCSGTLCRSRQTGFHPAHPDQGGISMARKEAHGNVPYRSHWKRRVTLVLSALLVLGLSVALRHYSGPHNVRAQASAGPRGRPRPRYRIAGT